VRIAPVREYVTNGQGVKRVVLALARMLPEAPTIKLLSAVLHRWPRLRLASSPAYHLGGRYAVLSCPHLAIARLKSGSQILLDLRDHAHRHLYFYGVIEQATTRLVERLAKSGWCVLDIGANAGYYALLSADLGGSRARVHAFEPQAELASLLRESIRLNGSPITVVEAACGAVAGDTTLFPSTDPNFNGMATAVPGKYMLSGQGIQVPLIRLDDYCAKHEVHPTLIKIDVEGLEAEVIAGLRATIARDRPDIICEVDFGDDQAVTVFELFSDLGYASYQIRQDGSLESFPVFAERVAGSNKINLCFRALPHARPEGKATDA